MKGLNLLIKISLISMIVDGFNEIYSIQFCINFRNILKKIIGGAYISQRVSGIS
jgi:hypothetical protein